MSSLVHECRHRQVLAYVRAPVDAGAVQVVEALSHLGAQTTESCQGPPLTIWFRYGEWWKNPWKEVSPNSPLVRSLPWSGPSWAPQCSST